MVKSRLNTKPLNEKHFQDRFKQYAMDCELTESDEEKQDQDLNEIFNSLTLNIGPYHDDVPEDHDNQQTSAFFSAYGEIDALNAASVTSELANKICIHSILKSDILADNLIEQPDHSSFITNTVSRYSSSEFLGVTIDTGASKR